MEACSNSLDDSQRLFIQYFIQKPVILHSETIKLYQACTATDAFDRDDFFSFLGTINDQLGLYDLTIRQIHCHVTGERNFVMVNLADDQIALEYGSDLKNDEIFAFKEIVSVIAATKRCRISTIELLNSKQILKFITDKNKLEKLVEKLLYESWLTKSENGKICIGVRSIVELGNWLRSEYIFPSCPFCNEFVTVGENCSEKCKFTSHVHCLKKFTSRNGTDKCIECSKEQNSE